MPVHISRFAPFGLAFSCALCGLALAQDSDPRILTRSPETKLEKIDHDRLAVRRLDIVDEKGVIRMTLGAPTPAPIIDGHQTGMGCR